jgi:hypothetical protein
MRAKLSFVLSGLLCGLMPATADIIFDNGGPDVTLLGYWSDYGAGLFEQQVSDDFALAAGATVIRDVHWWGGYDPEQYADDDFDVFLYADDAGLPGATLFVLTGVITRFSTGLADPLGFEIFGYDMVLDADVQLEHDTTYWLSIVNRTDSWMWQPSAISGHHARRGGLHDNDMAFRLTDDATVIPEPASMVLLGLALATLALRQRKSAG